MADEANPTPGASDTDQDAAGAAVAGAVTPPVATAERTPAATTEGLAAAERERYEQTQRDLQAAKDREASRAKALEDELATLKAGNKPADTPNAQLDPRTFYAEVQRLGRQEAAAESLKGEFKYADKAIFAKATEFASVEALRAAAEESHKAIESIINAEADARTQTRLEEFASKNGITLAPPPADKGQAPSGDLTIEAINAMTMDEQDAYEEANPGVIDRVIRSAFSTTR